MWTEMLSLSLDNEMGAKSDGCPSEPVFRALMRNLQCDRVIWHGQGFILMPGNSQDFSWLSRAVRLMHHLAHPARLPTKQQHKQQKGE